MGRIIETGQTPAKRRRAQERSCAEVLRLLAERPAMDEEGRDMAAFLVFSMRDIYKTIDESAAAWDERNYWKKAEALRQKYRWAVTSSDRLQAILLAGRWHEVPDALIELVSHFAHVTVTTVTRDADWWCGAYRALVRSEGSAADSTA